jgi:hypothetical protein
MRLIALVADQLEFTWPRWRRIALRAIVWSLCVVALALEISIVADGRRPAIDAAFLAAFIIVISLAVWFVERRVRVSVIADPHALRVRNSFRSHTIPWSEIEAYGDCRWTAAMKEVRLRGGGSVKLQGMAPSWYGARAPLEEQLAELEAYADTVSP